MNRMGVADAEILTNGQIVLIPKKVAFHKWNKIYFSSGSGGSPVYVPNHNHPREVLRGLDQLMIAEDLTEAVMVKINKLAFEGLSYFISIHTFNKLYRTIYSLL